MKRRQGVLAGGLLVALALGLAGTGAIVHGQDAEKKSIVVDGSTTVGPIGKAFAEHYMRQNPGETVSVSESGSGNGAKSLVNGTCDVAMMSRFMKDSEFKAAIDGGVMPVAHVVALDGIAVIVHPANPVTGLTVAQVRDIYTGRVTNWSQVGGPNLDIVAVSRDTNSGTYETFQGLVMGNEKMGAGTEYVGSNGAARSRVQTTRQAVAFVGLGFVDRTVKSLQINGVEATPATVVNGRYPIARPLFLFTSGYPTLGSHLYAYTTLHLTPKGQEIVEGLGFVPVTNYR
ncbi:MAG: phosphate ABC transporter substrate-binding protein [Candidatus Brocadiaceae bacterium]|nr:phosphate ABC transporter substrate-binding protein [Candidatus Brocadiaceae bacterium]